jgi:hypothetical protein
VILSSPMLVKPAEGNFPFALWADGEDAVGAENLLINETVFAGCDEKGNVAAGTGVGFVNELVGEVARRFEAKE